MSDTPKRETSVDVTSDCPACGGSGLGPAMYRPEIDKTQRDHCYTCKGFGENEKKLERELIKARANAEAWEKEAWRAEDLLERREKDAEKELAAVTEQRDRLTEAATVLIAAKGRHNTMLAYQGLRDALAAVEGGIDE